MNTLTLTGRGVQVTLFAPCEVAGGVEAFALMATAPLLRPRILKTENKKYRVPVIKEAGFYLAHILITEAR